MEESMSEIDLSPYIRNIPDFPKPGIQFKDITTLLNNGTAYKQAMDIFIERYKDVPLDVVVGIESRGFVFSSVLAYHMGIGMVPVRKPGKLPADTYQMEYELEYGTNTIEIHRDAFAEGARVLVIDDLLATGGTAAASCALVEKLGGIVHEVAFLIELTFLNGRDKLQKYPTYSVIQY
jgi:adenine phosphoribosyltransferase